MIEDLDSLESKINRYCSFVPLMEKRTNTSVKSKFSLLKNEISDSTTIFDFTNLVRRGLNLLNDGHTAITNKSSIKWFAEYSYLKSVTNASIGDTLYADYYNKLVSDSVGSICKSGIRAKYMDGKYYNGRAFRYNDRLINVGEEIKGIDGQDINQFINDNYDHMFSLLWDSNNKIWYSDFFMLALPFMGKSSFVLTIGDEKIPIDSKVTVSDLEKEKFSTFSQPKVDIISDDILYIYMPMMMNAQWYINQIHEKYNNDIKKIIIDLRGNGGGDDSVWASILSNLIDKPFGYSYQVGMNYNEELKKSISSFGEVVVNDPIMEVIRDRVIQPDDKSLKYAGKIYVLQDKYTFSAASAFVSAALQDSDRFKVIGEKSSVISGYTFPPLVFKLDNSGLIFKLAFSMDLTGGINNQYMDKVDVEINDNINEYFDKIYKYDCHSKDYLENNDKLIKYIVEQF
ncbi:MAG: hypothetical protein LBN74_08795 [Prevotella sp.]|nr:hypothetical protein [Prevotella sp.]